MLQKLLTQFLCCHSKRDARNEIRNDADAHVVEAAEDVISPETCLQRFMQLWVPPVHRY